MAQLYSAYKGYDTLNTYYTDTSLLSPDIFDISFFPNRFTVGKNLIKFRGNQNSLKVGTNIDVEILDSNGDTIYSEFIDYVDQDGSRVLSVYIYEDTAPGDATVIFVGEISTINNQSVPLQFQNQINVKWSRNIPVNPLDLNNSKIIFENDPIVTISENIGVQLNRSYANGQFPTYNTGKIKYVSQNNTPAIIVENGKFNGDMINGTLTVNNPINPLPTTNINIDSNIYSTTINKVLNDTTILLDFPYQVFDTQSNFSHTFNSFDLSDYQINYEATPEYIATQNSESFALIQVSDLEPSTGDISRIKVSVNSEGTVGAYEQINDIRLPFTEIFIDSTSSLTPDKSIGIYETQSIIDTYWEGHSYQNNSELAPPTLTWTTSSINNANKITGTLDLSQNNSVYVVQVKDQYTGIFVSQSMYNITLDAFAERDSTNLNPIMSIYASGSAFNFDSSDVFNQSLPKKLGKKIGEIECLGDSKRYDDISFEFNSDQSGFGSLLFVIESGNWQIADIRTTSDAEFGYTPNYIRFRTEIPTKHKSGNQLSFKIEYYNRVGDKSDTVNFVRNLNFEGGNRYIDGGFSMLTGSLFVADTLSSGVEITGLANTGYIKSLGYPGFNQATGSNQGGFLLFSGSALPGQTETSYSGVGLEMVSDENNFFRYRTNPSILDVHTETFFLGNPSTQFISGSDGQLEISSSGYHITPEGNITASKFLMEGGTISSTVNILGSVTTNQLFVPAGTTKTNARAFISSSGEAGFVGDGAGNYSIVLDGRTGETSTISGLTSSVDSLSTATYIISSSTNISDPVSFISSSAFKVSAGGAITGSAVLLGDKNTGNFLQFANDTLTVQGSITADNIRTPAQIGGSPSTDINASSSISADGFASFKSASIAGFEVNTEEIKSTNEALRLKSSGDITASKVLLEGGTITAGVTILGSLSANSILTPATIGGSPSTPANASSSISSEGLAIFKSASIAGFVVNTEEIKSANESLRLKATGQITGSNVLFTGGDIGGFELSSNEIKSSNNNLRLKDSGQITGSDVLFDGGKVGGFNIDSSTISGNNIIIDSAGSIQTADYASDFSGWKLSAENNGFLEVENAKIRGTLATAVFEKETVNAVGGQLYVANSTTLTSSALHPSDQYLPTDLTMSVVNVTGFANNEILTLKKVTNTGFSTEYIKVESSSRADSSSDTNFAGSIYVERGYSGSSAAGQTTASLGDSPGAAQSYSGSQVIVSTGKVGTGFIRLNSNPNDSATPYIDIVERTGSAIYDVKLKARLGDLSGLANSDIVFGNPDPGFGLATDNVYLQGGITATFGSIGGFSITSNAISSSNNNLILRDNGEITGSNVLLEGGRITSGVTIEGSVTANAIRTPATIGGSPSTTSNASSSIDSNGFASFKSASIAGFEITPDQISGGFIPASSSVVNTVVSASFTVNQTYAPGATGVQLANFVTNASGIEFWNNYMAGGDDLYIADPSSTTPRYNNTVSNVPGGRVNSVSVVDIVTLVSPYTIRASVSNGDGTFFNSDAGAGGGSPFTVVSSSTVIHPETPDSLLLKSSGEITGSNVLFTGGTIGGFELASTQINSSNNNLILRDSGQITGSDVLFTGGEIGGFTLSATEISSSGLLLKSSGEITASNADLSGKITATSGEVGGFSIETNSLTTTGVEINDSTQALFISSSGFKVTHPGAVTATSLVVENNSGTLLSTFTGFSDGKNIARNLPIQSTSDVPFVVFLAGEQKLVIMAMSTQNNGYESTLSGTIGVEFQRFLPDSSPAPETDTGNWSFSNPEDPGGGGFFTRRQMIRYVVDLSSMGASNRDLTNAAAFIQVTGTNIVTSQVQVTVHRNVGATGVEGDKNGGVIDAT